MLININNYYVLEGTTQGYYGNGELPDDYDYEAATKQLEEAEEDFLLWSIGVFS